jgi:hypothetical protein
MVENAVSLWKSAVSFGSFFGNRVVRWKFSVKATAATLLASKLVHRLLDLVSIVGMFVAFLGAVARAGYDAGMWWKTAHTSGYTNAEFCMRSALRTSRQDCLGSNKFWTKYLIGLPGSGSLLPV